MGRSCTGRSYSISINHPARPEPSVSYPAQSVNLQWSLSRERFHWRSTNALMEWIELEATRDGQKARQIWTLLADAGIHVRMHDVASAGDPDWRIKVPAKALAEATAALHAAGHKKLALLRRQLTCGRIRWTDALLLEFKHYLDSTAPKNDDPFDFHGEVFVRCYAERVAESVERLLPIFKSLEPKKGP